MAQVDPVRAALRQAVGAWQAGTTVRGQWEGGTCSVAVAGVMCVVVLHVAEGGLETCNAVETCARGET